MTTPKEAKLERKLRRARKKLKLALPHDPESKNDRRAQQARDAIATYRTLPGVRRKSTVRDLLADLMHLCDRDHRLRSFEASLDQARERYRKDTAEPFRD